MFASKLGRYRFDGWPLPGSSIQWLNVQMKISYKWCHPRVHWEQYHNILISDTDSGIERALIRLADDRS